MNAETAGLVKHKALELDQLGKDALARQVLKGLRLKTVVKVSSLHSLLHSDLRAFPPKLHFLSRWPLTVSLRSPVYACLE